MSNVENNIYEKSKKIVDKLSRIPMTEWVNAIYCDLQDTYEQGFRSGSKNYIPPVPVQADTLQIEANDSGLEERGLAALAGVFIEEDKAIEVEEQSEDDRLEELGWEEFRVFLRELGLRKQNGATIKVLTYRLDVGQLGLAIGI